MCSRLLAPSSASATVSQPCHVSSPRHVKRSGRFSRTTLSCRVLVKVYVPIMLGALSASSVIDAVAIARTAQALAWQGDVAGPQASISLVRCAQGTAWSICHRSRMLATIVASSSAFCLQRCGCSGISMKQNRSTACVSRAAFARWPTALMHSRISPLARFEPVRPATRPRVRHWALANRLAGRAHHRNRLSDHSVAPSV